MNARRPRTRMLLSLLAVLLPVAACGDDRNPAGTDEPAPGSVAGTVTVELGSRPFQLYVPGSYDSAQPAPLVVGLHGYSSDPAEMESYFGLVEQADVHGFLYAMPDGTTDRRGNQFWNATDACCDLYDAGVDDSTYLSQVIERVEQSYAVDPDRVFLIGHSNGGFMAHRMACDHADQISAIAVLAGATWQDPSRCSPSRPVSVLQIHGTADESIRYTGGAIQGNVYPGAEKTVARWRELDGCAGGPGPAPPALDLDGDLAGAETTVTAYTEGCGGRSRVELWRIDGAGHVPSLSDAFTPAVIDFLLSRAS